MQEVVTMIREGKLEEAESQLQGQQAAAAENVQWHFAHGLLCEARGDHEEAIDAYSQAVEIDPEYLEARFRLAYNLDLYGLEEKAIRIYEELAAETPVHVNALLNMTTLYEDLGQYEKALDCVERVLTEYPNHPRALMFFKDIQSSMNMFYDESQERTRVKRDAIMDTPISDFELSVRSRNCLKKMDIHTLGDLLRINEAELLAYKNFGETSLNEIKVMLSQKGLRLGQLKEEAQRASRTMPAPRRTAADGSPEILNRFLSEIEFSSRARKCLQRLNLVTVGDLTCKTEAELLATKNFGQTSLAEIKGRLGEFGLELRKST